MSKLTRNLSFATMTAAAVFVQSALATSQHDAHDAVSIVDLDGEIYQNALNIDVLNDSYVNQVNVISGISHGQGQNAARIGVMNDTLFEHDNEIGSLQANVGRNDARITGNDNDISALTQSVNDIAITAATAWQWTRDNDGFVYQNQSRGLANQRRIAEQNVVVETHTDKLVEHRGYIDTNWSRTIANEQSAAVNATAISGNKEISDTQFHKVWDLALYNNNYVVDAWMMTLDNEERLKETQATLVNTNIAVDANRALLATTVDETNAMNAYLGVLPEDNESDTIATLYKHAIQENIHLGAGAQVGDNLNEGDSGYVAEAVKTGMTSVGANSRADGDESTSIGGRSKAYGAGSVSVGYQSVANEDNTVSFGNDYQAGVEAIEAVEYQAEIQAVAAVEYQAEIQAVEAADGVEAVEYQAEVQAVDAVEYQAEVQAVEAVEGKAEILENNRRLTHVADGIDKNDVVNVKQLNTTAQYLDDRQRATEERLLAGQVTWNDKLETLSDKAMHGIAISMATKVFLPDPGKKFRVNVGVAEYEGASALGISGSGRINNDTALYFGLGTDTAGEHTAVQAGASYQW